MQNEDRENKDDTTENSVLTGSMKLEETLRHLLGKRASSKSSRGSISRFHLKKRRTDEEDH